MTEFGLILVFLGILLCFFVVLTERKLLSHAQRRFGPSIAGRNGWLQIVLDLVKLMGKEFFIMPRTGSFLLPIYITIFYAIQLLFSQNFIFGPSMFMFDQLDGLIFYHLILVMMGNIAILIVGFLSQSKYSIIGVVRGVVHVVSLDIFITLIYILIVMVSQSGNFHDYTITQTNTYYMFLFAPVSFAFIILLLVEAKRAPFDHVETEAEMVAGYATEHGGIFLLVFYLSEYMHLVISANHFTIFFLGGWSLISHKVLLLPFLVPFNDVNYWSLIFI